MRREILTTAVVCKRATGVLPLFPWPTLRDNHEFYLWNMGVGVRDKLQVHLGYVLSVVVQISVARLIRVLWEIFIS